MNPPNKAAINALLQKVEKVTQQRELDLSSGEDLSIGIMNLISIEEHLFFTAQKTGKKTYLPLLNEVRLMRTTLLKEIIKDSEGEIWCISKHLLSASMRLMEVGTKELKLAEGAELAEAEKHETKAWSLFEKSFKLYSLFWGLNLELIKPGEMESKSVPISPQLPQSPQDKPLPFLIKLGQIVQKAIDCCRE
ncbi:MAG: hypothetical protein HYS86_01535 [Candidatus Chisholmbacteria bacterium]|nr:hypothetical protein [Candidatus Chisholmbacteria bacterium]